MDLFKINIDLLPINIAIYEVKNNEFTFSAFNTCAEKTEKISRDKLLGRKIDEVFPKVKNFGLYDVMLRVYQSGQSEDHEDTYYHDERVSGWRKNHITKVSDHQIAAIYHDTSLEKYLKDKGVKLEQELSEVKETLYYQEQLKASELKFKNIVEASTDWIWETDQRGIYSYSSPAVEKLLGYQANEIIGKSVFDLMPADEAIRFAELFKKYRDNKQSFTGVENHHIHKNGTKILFSISAMPIVDESGNFLGCRGINRDLSLEKKMSKDIQKFGNSVADMVSLSIELDQRKLTEEELRKYQSQLESMVKQRTEEFESVNQELESFTYSVSHDLRTPLRGIDGFSKLLFVKYQQQLDQQGQDYIQRIRSGTQRMGKLIDDMLQLSRVSKAELKLQEVNLSNIAQLVVSELQQADPERHVEIQIEAELKLQSDINAMRIVLDNLIGNAWKFTSKSEHAKIEIGCIIQTNEPVYFVRDNGAGFDMRYTDKLFQVFQRLHSSKDFPGTGVGLSTVARLIERLHGRIWAESEIGTGTSLYFSFNTMDINNSEKYNVK